MPYRLTALLPSRLTALQLSRLTVLPPYHLTALPPYRLTRLTALPPYRVTALPPYRLTAFPPCRLPGVPSFRLTDLPPAPLLFEDVYRFFCSDIEEHQYKNEKSCAVGVRLRTGEFSQISHKMFRTSSLEQSPLEISLRCFFDNPLNIYLQVS